MDAEAIDPQNARVLELRDSIAAAREIAWARTKSVRRAVSAAAHSLTAADFNGAQRLVDEALAIEPSHPEALALRSRIAEMRAIARTKEEQDGRRQESEPRRLAAEREHLEQTQIARAPDHERDHRAKHELAREAAQRERRAEREAAAHAIDALTPTVNLPTPILLDLRPELSPSPCRAGSCPP